MRYFLCPRTPSSAFRNQFWAYCTKFSPPVHRQFLHVARCFYGAPVRAPEFSRICMAGFACNLPAVAQSTIHTASVETPYGVQNKTITDTSTRRRQYELQTMLWLCRLLTLTSNDISKRDHHCVKDVVVIIDVHHQVSESTKSRKTYLIRRDRHLNRMVQSLQSSESNR